MKSYDYASVVYVHLPVQWKLLEVCRLVLFVLPSCGIEVINNDDEAVIWLQTGGILRVSTCTIP